MSKKRAAPPRPSPARRPPVRRSRTPGWLLPTAMAVAGLVLIFVFLVLFSRCGGTPATNSNSTLPSGAATGQTVDDIQCQTQEQVAYHVHAHLAIFAGGQPRTVPPGIGIPGSQVVNTADGPAATGGSCIYWLHTHYADGIIHIESPSQRTYTLGNFFNIWGQPLSPTQVGADTGPVTAYVNGQKFTGNPRDIPLTAHAVIQLNVGTDVAPRPYTFAPEL